MESFIFLIVGMLLMYLILQRPLRIEVHHKQENVVQPISEVDMTKMQEEMLKDDPKEDIAYEQLDKVMLNISNVMGGSDKINDEE